jgi:hypothetical protein
MSFALPLKLQLKNLQVRGGKKRKRDAYLIYDERLSDADNKVIADFGL